MLNPIGLMSWVSAIGSVPGWIIPKTQKRVHDAPLLNTEHYKVRIKGKVDQSKECSNTLPYTFVY